MLGTWSSSLSGHGMMRGFNQGEKSLGFASMRRPKSKMWKHVEQVSLWHSSRPCKAPRIRVAMVENRVSSPGRTLVNPSDILAYDLIQGADVRWSYIMDKSVPEPPTAVLLHGILGSRKNWGTFSRRLAQEFPRWQFLLVDLRCHGDSASIIKRGPHTVDSAALDVLKLLGHLKLTPRVIVGHSFGGKGNLALLSHEHLPNQEPCICTEEKLVHMTTIMSSVNHFVLSHAVALSMVEQAPKPLARPVRVWVLDATPGKVRAGGDGEDHPLELISFLRTLPNKVSSKQYVVDSLVQEGFSKDVAQWVATNLRLRSQPRSSSSSFSWVFNLDGIAEMYQSYEENNLWKIVEDVPRGVHINFLKAERSLHRWALEDLHRIHAAEEQAVEEGGGVEMHVLEDAGHWVQADNPDGLFKILSFSFLGF